MLVSVSRLPKLHAQHIFIVTIPRKPAEANRADAHGVTCLLFWKYPAHISATKLAVLIDVVLHPNESQDLTSYNSTTPSFG